MSGAPGSVGPMWIIVLAAATIGCAHNRAETAATAQDAGPGTSAATASQQRVLFISGGADGSGSFVFAVPVHEGWADRLASHS